MQGIQSLSITQAHSLKVHDLPPHHNDLFDRLLLAQALVEPMVVLTSDHAFKKYPVEIGWVRTLEAVPQTGKPPILQAAFRILRNR